MITISVKIDKGVARLGKLPDEFRAAIRKEIDGLATDLRDLARSNLDSSFKTHSGDLRKAIKKSVRSNKKGVIGKVYIGNRQGYIGHILEVGAKPHEIRPKNAKALAFIASGGGALEVKSVQHPGFAGRTFFSAAWQQKKPEIKQGIAAAVNDAVVDNNRAAASA